MRPQPKGTVRFTRHGDTWTLDFAFDRRVNEFIKSGPNWAWSFDGDIKKWSILQEAHAKSVAANLRAAGYKVTGFGEEHKLPPPPPPAVMMEPVDWAVALLEAVGPDLRERVYKSLAKVLHADVGGSDQLMTQLNAARAAVNGDKK